MKNFNWSNFSAAFLNAVINSPKTPKKLRPSFNTDDAVMLCPYMDGIAKVPHDDFIKKYRDEIELVFLKNEPSVLVRTWLHCTGKKLKKSEAELTALELDIMLKELMSKRFTPGLVLAYRRALVIVGKGLDEDAFVSRFAIPKSFDLTNAKIPENILHPFQQDAISALERGLNENDAGLLVMPTGSGKTMTATWFILSKMMNQGYQVVWLTHRHMLIEQPAESFEKLSGLVRENNPKAESLNMVCVSGVHSNIARANK